MQFRVVIKPVYVLTLEADDGVDAIKKASEYNFLALIPDQTKILLEKRNKETNNG